MKLGELSLDAAKGVDELPLIEVGDGLLDPLEKVGGQCFVFLLHHVVFQCLIHHFPIRFDCTVSAFIYREQKKTVV